jgi:hypothetical protein
MSALLLTLAAAIGVTMVTTRASIARHTGELVNARRVNEMAIQSLALLHVQDDMSKSMLLDPDRMDSRGVAKVEVHDEATALLKRMDSLSSSADLKRLTSSLHALEEDKLRALDTPTLAESVAAVAEQSAASAEEMSAQSVHVAEAITRIAKISSNGQDAPTPEDETLPIMARKLDRLIAGFEV